MTQGVLLASAFFLVQVSAEPLVRPAELVAAALADVRTTTDAHFYRFFDLGSSRGSGNSPELLSVLQFAVNSLSRRKLLSRLTPVSSPGNRLVRLDLRTIALDGSSWDELGRLGSGPLRSTQATACPEPYYHLQHTITYQEVTEKLVDCAPFRQDGRWYNQRWEKVAGEPKTKTELIHAPWVAAGQIAELVQRTQSEFPILRADWFVTNALLPPAYQRLLGIKTLTDFQKQVRFRERDEDLAIRGNILFSSQVALHNRALLRTPTVLGYYWRSLDYLSSVGDADVLANVLAEKSDASEIIASAANGLQHYLIVDGQGKVIDFADPNIAVDRTTAWDNKLVWTGYSCMVCHAQGLKEFADDVRRLADLKKQVFAVVKPEYTERFLDLFGPDHREFIKTDQARYAAVVQACTGTTPEENAKRLSRIFLDYMQKPVTLAEVSLETGYAEAKILTRLRTAKGISHTLVQLVAGMPLRRDQFEREYGRLMILLEANN